jgi:hypothetical protein
MRSETPYAKKGDPGGRKLFGGMHLRQDRQFKVWGELRI